ncbi:pirin family protein [Alteromonas sp. ASW11-19]|uniref:Pirin family protein n=1 Tax=Alteromonas salexigens TaxID=2982530 RepID=A0ABT2VLZ1_9ALTE|nr:pirin family protein [Alteromonas salexigens]MCU7554100.1 pirin family protein [Alteromonas salexigens]
MRYIRRADERGRVDFGWLQSRHSFSFGHYYDPAHMGFSVLRVINDDVVAAGRGFDTHGHRDMEIISYVVSGSLAHKDSTGTDGIIPAGDIQRMSAGKGIMHSEYNPSETDTANFLQIWILPQHRGIAPSYAQRTISQNGSVTPLITPDGSNGTLSINQDMSLFRVFLQDNQSQSFSTHARWGYLHVINGSLDIDGSIYRAGDAIGLSEEDTITITASQTAEALWFDLPPG